MIIYMIGKNNFNNCIRLLLNINIKIRITNKIDKYIEIIIINKYCNYKK